jgi:hypothetical protein
MARTAENARTTVAIELRMTHATAPPDGVDLVLA